MSRQNGYRTPSEVGDMNIERAACPAAKPPVDMDAESRALQLLAMPAGTAGAERLEVERAARFIAHHFPDDQELREILDLQLPETIPVEELEGAAALVPEVRADVQLWHALAVVIARRRAFFDLVDQGETCAQAAALLGVEADTAAAWIRPGVMA